MVEGETLQLEGDMDRAIHATSFQGLKIAWEI
jgi:hypothetical protein